MLKKMAQEASTRKSDRMVYDTVATTALHRFVTRRQGYLEMIVYRPSATWPQLEETFSYIIPTVKTEKIEKILSNY